MEGVRCAPKKSKSYVLAAAFAAWEAVAADEKRLVCLAVLPVMNDLVNASLWYARSGRALNKRSHCMCVVHRIYCCLPFRFLGGIISEISLRTRIVDSNNQDEETTSSRSYFRHYLLQYSEDKWLAPVSCRRFRRFDDN